MERKSCSKINNLTRGVQSSINIGVSLELLTYCGNQTKVVSLTIAEERLFQTSAYSVPQMNNGG